MSIIALIEVNAGNTMSSSVPTSSSTSKPISHLPLKHQEMDTVKSSVLWIVMSQSKCIFDDLLHATVSSLFATLQSNDAVNKEESEY